jgi:hypothetical protein
MANKVNSELPEHADKPLTCGLIMPISSIDGCTAEHWAEVKSIITDAVNTITEFSFSVNLVSDQEDVGVIQKRIVQNIYSSDVVVCDVSCKNPNVMFELGMRLAFDKPTLIIKDDGTDYSFDTGVVEHLNYPRDLRFAKIVSFKQNLASKICATYKASLNDTSQSFLSSFGTFKVAKLDQAEGSPEQVLIEMVQDLSRQVSKIGNDFYNREAYGRTIGGSSGLLASAFNELPISSKSVDVRRLVLISSGPSESMETLASSVASMGVEVSLTLRPDKNGSTEYVLTIHGSSSELLQKINTLAVNAGVKIKEIRRI